MILPIDPVNGVLRYVQGPYVSEGERLLPDPATASQDSYVVEVDAGPDLGRVSLSYRRKQNPRFKAMWFWVCVRADPVVSHQAGS